MDERELNFLRAAAAYEAREAKAHADAVERAHAKLARAEAEVAECHQIIVNADQVAAAAQARADEASAAVTAAEGELGLDVQVAADVAAVTGEAN